MMKDAMVEHYEENLMVEKVIVIVMDYKIDHDVLWIYLDYLE